MRDWLIRRKLKKPVNSWDEEFRQACLIERLMEGNIQNFVAILSNKLMQAPTARGNRIDLKASYLTHKIVRALGKCSDAIAAEALTGLLKDFVSRPVYYRYEDDYVGALQGAVVSLRSLGPRGVLSTLIRSLDHVERILVARSKENIDDAQRFIHLETTIVRVLNEIGDAAAVPALEQLLARLEEEKFKGLGYEESKNSLMADVVITLVELGRLEFLDRSLELLKYADTYKSEEHLRHLLKFGGDIVVKIATAYSLAMDNARDSDRKRFKDTLNALEKTFPAVAVWKRQKFGTAPGIVLKYGCPRCPRTEEQPYPAKPVVIRFMDNNWDLRQNSWLCLEYQCPNCGSEWSEVDYYAVAGEPTIRWVRRFRGYSDVVFLHNCRQCGSVLSCLDTSGIDGGYWHTCFACHFFEPPEYYR